MPPFLLVPFFLLVPQGAAPIAGMVWIVPLVVFIWSIVSIFKKLRQKKDATLLRPVFAIAIILIGFIVQQKLIETRYEILKDYVVILQDVCKNTQDCQNILANQPNITGIKFDEEHQGAMFIYGMFVGYTIEKDSFSFGTARGDDIMDIRGGVNQPLTYETWDGVQLIKQIYQDNQWIKVKE